MANIDIREYLSAHGIRPSLQRIAVMDYLLHHHTHPSVDEIYNALLPVVPTLSKSTLYNTLKLFADHNVALMLGIDEHNARFDGNVEPHAHFMCVSCGRIFDIDEAMLPGLRGVVCHSIGEFNVLGTELNYRGYCPDCTESQKN